MSEREQVENKPKLTPKMTAFVREYTADYNGTQAAIRAGYSPHTAQEQASRLLSNVIIIAAIEEIEDERTARSQVSNDRLFQELERIATFDARKLYDEKGNAIPLRELDDDTAAVIAGLKVFEEFDGKGEERVLIGYTKEYKISDKQAAIEKLLKSRGLLVERKDITSGNEPIKFLVGVDPNDV